MPPFPHRNMALPPSSLFVFFFFFLPMLSADSSAERAALLSFKNGIRNADPALQNWNASTPLCSWSGVTCAGGAVTELSLAGFQLSGKLSPSLSNLVSLTRLNLSKNELEGPIPAELGNLASLQILELSSNPLSGVVPPSLGNCSQLIALRLRNDSLRGSIPPELGTLRNLRLLLLSENNLSGPIPSSLGEISTLVILDLAANSLSGKIPPELGNLSNLTVLYLQQNNLSGGIPPHLGNLSRLNSLYLHTNQLDGEIPAEIGGARSLKFFDVFSNRLSGRIPLSLFNLSSLVLLHAGFNRLSGYLPSDLGKNLPSLQNLHLFGNQLEGSISPFISNATSLEFFELSQNRISGVIPSELGELKSLKQIDLSNNYLQAEGEEDWSFISSMADCRDLTKLELYNNSLGGALPSTITNLSSSLEVLRLEGNKIEGTIPDGWERFLNITTLKLGGNKLTGKIPDSVGKLKSLKVLFLEENELSGEIPSSLGNLSGLLELSLGGNQLRGKIPPSLGALSKLQSLNLSSNALTGEIPREILSLVSLTKYLDLSGNDLEGPLWPEVGKLTNLNTMNLSRNRLSGEIPSSVGDAVDLVFLLLEDNIFRGSIPPEIGKLLGLQELDLSDNEITGQVPEFLAKLRLRRLNLSNNNFEGKVPEIFNNASGVSLFGNPRLCSDDTDLLLRRCSRQKNSTSIMIAVSISAIIFLVILTTVVFLCFAKLKKCASSVPSDACYGGISYEELRKCTGGFSPANIIGRGAHGCVYGGRLWKNKQPVAVKVFELGSAGAARSFMAELTAMKNIRHRNLVKTLASISGVDEQGNEFMALVYELMPNGSLDRWIHQEELGARRPGIFHRLSIAIDVACAIEYLHQCIDVPIIHGDLKPGNVLLDGEMTARVGDFGLSRFLHSESSRCSTQTVELKGTIGYVAPELSTLYKPSTASDVYSFGILLLEIFTGKRPTDPMFDEGLTLRSFVEKGLPSRVFYVADAKLFGEEEKEEGGHGDESIIRCLVSVFKLGLLCSEESEKDRPTIAEAVRALTLTRDALIQANEMLLPVHVER